LGFQLNKPNGGLLDALSVTVNSVKREPAPVGLNLTMIVQEELAASVALQVPEFVFTTSPVSQPVWSSASPLRRSGNWTSDNDLKDLSHAPSAEWRVCLDATRGERFAGRNSMVTSC
jgi:hypothetical protein